LATSIASRHVQQGTSATKDIGEIEEIDARLRVATVR
jgi:hypothetical protein